MTDSKNVLIQCGDHFDNKRRILSLALHLKNIGLNPVVIQYSFKDSYQYFEYFGIQVEFLNKLKTLKKNDNKLEGHVFDALTNFQRKKESWRFDKNRISDLVYTVSRDFYAVQSLLKKFQPCAIFVWNGFTGNVANSLRYLCEIMPSIKSYYMERSYFKDCLFVDPLGVNGASYISELSSDYFANMTEVKTDICPSPNLLKGSVVDFSQKIRSKWPYLIFLPLQVQTDTNIIMYSDKVRKMKDFVLSVSESSKRVSNDIAIVVRSHPEEVEKKLELPLADNVFYSSLGSSDDWCLASDLVITINSTVGLDALIKEQGVISLGKSIYSGKGLTMEPTDMDDSLDEMIRTCFSSESKPSDVSAYLSYLYIYHTSAFNNFPRIISKLVKDRIELPNRPVSIRFKEYEVLQNIVDEKGFLNICCIADKAVFLNLTYRKTKELVSLEYIHSFFSEELDLEKDKISVTRTDTQNIGGFDFENYDLIVVEEELKKLVEDTGLIVTNYYFVPYKG